MRTIHIIPGIIRQSQALHAQEVQKEECILIKNTDIPDI